MMPKHISPSAGAMHDACPQKWKYKYIDRLPDPMGPAAQLGIDFEKIVFKHWNDPIPKNGEIMMRHENPKIGKMLSALFTYSGVKALPRIKDSQVKIDVPCGGSRLLGFLDMLHTDGSITDLKTSSKPWTQERVAKSEQHLAYPYGCIKAGLVSAVFPVTFRYLIVTTAENPQVQVMTFKISEKALDGYERRFKTRLHQIRLETEMGMFPANRGPDCYFCPYKGICPAWK